MTKTPATAILKTLLAKTPDLKVDVGVPGLGEDDSDYYPFCAKGIPMVAFFTDDPTCYHKACDTEDRIDYVHLGQIAKTGGELALGLADSTTDLLAARSQLKVSDLGCPK